MVACSRSTGSGGRRNEIVSVDDYNVGEEPDPDPSTIPTTNEEQQEFPSLSGDAWPTAEGYTPLGDMLSMGSVLVAMPPRDDDDVDEDTESNGNTSNMGGTYPSSGPNAFVMDPSALFGNATFLPEDNSDEAEGNSSSCHPDENDTTGMINNSYDASDEVTDYRDAASIALMALENDYNATLQGQIRPSLMDTHPPSLSGVGGPAMPLFGDTSSLINTSNNHDLYNDNDSDECFADFDSAEASSSISAGNTTPQQKEAKVIPEIDSAAVQKAVEGIVNNSSDRLGTKLKLWQEEQDRIAKERHLTKACCREKLQRAKLFPEIFAAATFCFWRLGGCQKCFWHLSDCHQCSFV